jgi:DNA-binding response OmpR family regulator
MGNTSTTLHVLLLTADPALVAAFTDLSKEFHIETQSSQDCQDASAQLSREKYEGVVLDFDTIANARPVLASVRESRSNKNAIVFAVATNTTHMEQALQDRAHFLLRRPIDNTSMKQTLHAAYDLMEKERRRYFRVPANLSVAVISTDSGIHVQCTTTNISNDGMAVTTPTPFRLAESVEIALVLPDGFIVRATGIVIWDDKHGKSGLHFHCTTPEMRQKLDCWLDSRFAAHSSQSRPF